MRTRERNKFLNRATHDKREKRELMWFRSEGWHLNIQQQQHKVAMRLIALPINSCRTIILKFDDTNDQTTLREIWLLNKQNLISFAKSTSVYMTGSSRYRLIYLLLHHLFHNVVLYGYEWSALMSARVAVI